MNKRDVIGERNMMDTKYEPGDQVQILVGGPHENYLRIATVNRVQHDGDVVIYLGDQDEDEWVYSPDELRPHPCGVCSAGESGQKLHACPDGMT